MIFEMRKNNDVFVDYKQLKACVSIIMVLDHYGWVRELKGTGNTVRSTCPIHNGGRTDGASLMTALSCTASQQKPSVITSEPQRSTSTARSRTAMADGQ